MLYLLKIKTNISMRRMKDKIPFDFSDDVEVQCVILCTFSRVNQFVHGWGGACLVSSCDNIDLL